MRIAMWSGPRNLSTALMYSFGNREDFAIWDEPFYAPYLAVSGADHPLRQEVIAAHETDPEKVAAACMGPIPDEKSHFYMKHMAHHMIEGFPLNWTKDCVNVHLIRHPARVITSYASKRAIITEDDIGFVRQKALYDQIGGLVIDSSDIRKNPRDMLELLCDAVGLPFDEAMLKWEPGSRNEDGAWAPHWYDAVHQSTGFAAAEGPIPNVNTDHKALFESALPIYEALSKSKI